MDIDIRFPLFIFEPSKDYSDTFMWKLYEACRIKDSNCELLSRYIFDAVYRPPLRLMSQKGINGSFGFYDCESSLDLFRMSVDERKDPADGQEHPAYKVFVLSLWDIFYRGSGMTAWSCGKGNARTCCSSCGRARNTASG